MKINLTILLLIHSLVLYGQTIPKEIQNVNNIAEFDSIINEISKSYGNELNFNLQSELKRFNYHALIRELKNDKKFNKIFDKSGQTITMTLLSTEYEIYYSFVTLSLNKKTYIYSFDHSSNKIDFISCEKESNSFLSIANTLQDHCYYGLLIVVNRFPDNDAGIEVIKGLSMSQMQTLLYLGRFAKNIEK